MARRDEGVLDLLAKLPWWVSVCVAVAVYVALKFVVPSLASNNILLKSLTPQFAWVAAVFLVPAAISAIEGRQEPDQAPAGHEPAAVSASGRGGTSLL